VTYAVTNEDLVLLREHRRRSVSTHPPQAAPSLAGFVEGTAAVTLEPWQHVVCNRLERLHSEEGQRVLMHGPPQFGKPCYNKCMILMHDGSRKALQDVQIGDMVISHTGMPRRVSAVHVQGDLECVEITTRSGRQTIAALDHPFLTPEGWVKAGDLLPFQTLANVSEPKCYDPTSLGDAQFELAGYFIGDGATGPAGQSSIHANITSNDPVQAERFTELAASLGFQHRVFQKQNTTALTYAFRGGIRDWLRQTDLAGYKSGFKRVPEWVFHGTNEQIALFLGSYFSCDGTVSKKGLDRKGEARAGASIEFYSISEPLLRDVQHLLLRVGVQSRLAVKTGKYIGTKHTSYRLTINSQDYIAQFARMVPVAGVKGERLRNIRVLRKTFQPPMLEDQIVSVVPVGLKPCRCLTVDVDHTFTVDDLVVHNSLIISQRWPAYSLGKKPLARFRLACYNLTHAERFSKVNLAIMQSDDYKLAFPDSAARVPERAKAEEWSTTARAALLDANPSFKALGLGTGFTGLGVDTLIIDDPYKNREEALSETVNASIWGWWSDVVLPRLNPATNVVIMFHRWQDDDFAGRLLQQGGWEYLRFAAIADGADDDPMERGIGELLSPRYPLEYLEDVRQKQGSSFYALYQGTPRAAEGDYFKRGWFGSPVGALPVGCTFVRYWDLAGGTSDKADYTAGVLMARDVQGYFYVVDVIHGKWAASERNATIIQTAYADRHAHGSVQTYIEQAPGLSKEPTEDLVRQLAGFSVYADRVNKDKVSRAEPYQAQAQAGNVRLLDAAWNGMYLDELCAFPTGTHDDLVDASSGAFNKLADAGQTFATSYIQPPRRAR
jgi:predicted phage terminase large subunit-like protein